ncbi:hypothetical protein FKW77_005907 [Venturia effusa]|uniref:SMP-30/Gluconolactonase/LRE-like region domain-containing protein n=1 Tax=Venturia effusa TaxID=50376 RepID=A0A517LMY2_9PEZI|nr:hypothetical protein FKW77_005907 [Venturia effusa]
MSVKANGHTSPFLVLDPAFQEIIGPNPTLELLSENHEYPFAHEAGIFNPTSNELFITSNQHPCKTTGSKQIKILRVKLEPKPSSCSCSEIETENVPMANGGVSYQDGMLFCAQGTLTQPGGIAYMSAQPPHRSHFLVQTHNGKPFNSPNDVVVHSNGSIWFTDPVYGHEQGIRPPPELPNQVYCFEPESGEVRVVADGFGRPNGICFSPDEKVVYITDTDRIHGDGSVDPSRPATIHAFDVVDKAGQLCLVNRRLFAVADCGWPDGIKCDIKGNVYSGCGDGVHVWSPTGKLLGKILVKGGVANFCFGRNGEVFLLNEHKLWRAQLSKSTKGALLRI